MLVNNVSPDGKNWSFNTFYPDYLQAHPATRSSSAWRRIRRRSTVHVLTVGMTPLEWYSGFSGGFLQSDLTRPGGWQTPVLRQPAGLLAGAPTRTLACSTQTVENPDWSLASTPASSSTRRRQAARQHVVHDRAGSRASARPLLRHERCRRTDDELPHRHRTGRPARADKAGDVEVAAQRQYEADLAGSPASIG